MRCLDKDPRSLQLSCCVHRSEDSVQVLKQKSPEDKVSSEVSQCQRSLHEAKEALDPAEQVSWGETEGGGEGAYKQEGYQKQRVRSLAEGDEEPGKWAHFMNLER